MLRRCIRKGGSTFVEVAGDLRSPRRRLAAGPFSRRGDGGGEAVQYRSARQAFFGQKDAAQVAVLRRMVRDLNFNLELVVCPTVRETDGLAMSSRNRYLSADERQQALVLSRTLRHIEARIAAGVVDSARADRCGPDCSGRRTRDPPRLFAHRRSGDARRRAGCQRWCARSRGRGSRSRTADRQRADRAALSGFTAAIQRPAVVAGRAMARLSDKVFRHGVAAMAGAAGDVLVLRLRVRIVHLRHVLLIDGLRHQRSWCGQSSCRPSRQRESPACAFAGSLAWQKLHSTPKDTGIAAHDFDQILARDVLRQHFEVDRLGLRTSRTSTGSGPLKRVQNAVLAGASGRGGAARRQEGSACQRGTRPVAWGISWRDWDGLRRIVASRESYMVRQAESTRLSHDEEFIPRRTDCRRWRIAAGGPPLCGCQCGAKRRSAAATEAIVFDVQAGASAGDVDAVVRFAHDVREPDRGGQGRK